MIWNKDNPNYPSGYSIDVTSRRGISIGNRMIQPNVMSQPAFTVDSPNDVNQINPVGKNKEYNPIESPILTPVPSSLNTALLPYIPSDSSLVNTIRASRTQENNFPNQIKYNANDPTVSYPANDLRITDNTRIAPKSLSPVPPAYVSNSQGGTVVTTAINNLQVASPSVNGEKAEKQHNLNYTNKFNVVQVGRMVHADVSPKFRG